MDFTNSDSERKKYNQRLMAGCSFVFVIFFFFVAFGLVELVKYDRESVRYPGAASVAAHSNYTGLPRSYTWDDSFRTDAGFHAVYKWYSITFDMGAESRANGGCILLETDAQYFIAERFMTVTICGAPDGQLVFVDRTTTFR